jgi:hypothetical protein
VGWKQWYDFYQVVIKPLVEAGVEVKIQLHLDADGEVDANSVDLSIKQSVVRLSPDGIVKIG